MFNKRGVAGLNVLLSVVAMLFMIGLIVMVFALMGGELSEATSETVIVSSPTSLQTSSDEYDINGWVWDGWYTQNWTPTSDNLIDDDYDTHAQVPVFDEVSSLVAKYYIPTDANLSESQIHLYYFSEITNSSAHGWVSGSNSINTTLTASLNTYGNLTDCYVQTDGGGDYLEIIYDSFTSVGQNYINLGCEVVGYSGGASSYYPSAGYIHGGVSLIDLLYLAQSPDAIGINGSRLYEEEILWYGDFSETQTQGSSATAVIDDTTSSIAGVTTWFPIIVTITAMIVLILLVIIIITAIRGSGLIPEESA